MKINYKKLNPVGFQLMKYMQDTNIRFIILYGGSSSGKSYSVAQLILIFTLWEGSNSLVMRKVGASISKSIYEDFKVAAKQLHIYELFSFKDGVKQIVCNTNRAKIDFCGLDDPEKIKGISNYKRVVLDEWSEFDEEDNKQIRKRLRGKKGQQIITTFNPIKETHWIKKEEFDSEKWHEVPMNVEIGGKMIPQELTAVKSIRMNEPKFILNPRTRCIEEHPSDKVIIQTTYLNNFWVVGSPDGTYGFYDEQCVADFERDRVNDPDYYNVYALGEWGVIRTGSEFFSSFNRGTHTAECHFTSTLPIHISVDSNVLPYITTTYWQISIESNLTELRQIEETCAENPNNTVRKSAKLVAARLKVLNPEKVFIHGDASTKHANNIDDEKRSFMDLFIETLRKEGVEVEDRVKTSNPSVPMSGEFINAIFDNVLPQYKIVIGENCKTSIEDYMSVQKDVNGAILKTKVKNKNTGQTYEEHGHISDTFRYVVTDLLEDAFRDYSNKRKWNIYAKDGALKFYNPDTECAYDKDLVYAMPNINGKFAMVHGKLCGDKWHIVSAVLTETVSTEDIMHRLVDERGKQTILEAPDAYMQFSRNLRRQINGVRVTSESPDIDRRIAATYDYALCHILFNPQKFSCDIAYSDFLNNMLDYRKDSVSKEASACISGFAEFAVKFGFHT